MGRHARGMPISVSQSVNAPITELRCANALRRKLATELGYAVGRKFERVCSRRASRRSTHPTSGFLLRRELLPIDVAAILASASEVTYWDAWLSDLARGMGDGT
jgi:hypothetical protein